MNQTPSQYELATLAASIPIPDCWKDDAETNDELLYRANRAFDLWQICGGLIADAPAAIAAKAKMADARAQFYSQFSDFSDDGSVPLDFFLKTVMPGKPLADITQTWWRFRTRNLAPDQVPQRVEADGLGLSMAGLHIVCGQFLRFNAESAAVIASDKAATAARVRHLPKQREEDAKREAARLRRGRGYVVPETESDPEAIAQKIATAIGKAKERRLSVKKRVANPGIKIPAPKQTTEPPKQESQPAKQSKPPRKQRK